MVFSRFVYFPTFFFGGIFVYAVSGRVFSLDVDPFSIVRYAQVSML